jgi:hypothetical protein
MGGGRGDTDLRVGMLRAGPLAIRSSIGLGEYLGFGLVLAMRSSIGFGEYLGFGLVARGFTIGV